MNTFETHRLRYLGFAGAAIILAAFFTSACANVSLLDDFDELQGSDNLDPVDTGSDTQTSNGGNDTGSGGDTGTGSDATSDSEGIVISFYERFFDWAPQDENGYTRLLLGPPSGPPTPGTWDEVLADTEAMQNPQANRTWAFGARALIPENWHGLQARIALERYLDARDTDAAGGNYSVKRFCIGPGDVAQGPATCEVVIDCTDPTGYQSVAGPGHEASDWSCNGTDTDAVFYQNGSWDNLSHVYLVSEPFTVPTAP